MNKDSLPKTVTDRKEFRKLMRKLSTQTGEEYDLQNGIYVFPTYAVGLIDDEVKVLPLDSPLIGEAAPPRERKPSSGEPKEPKARRAKANVAITMAAKANADGQWEKFRIALPKEGLTESPSDRKTWYCFDLSKELDIVKILKKLRAMDIEPTEFTRLRGNLIGLGPIRVMGES